MSEAIGDERLIGLLGDWSAEGHGTLARRLAQGLRARGWRFIGPTSAYAALQAMGVVNDHLEGCHARGSATR